MQLCVSFLTADKDDEIDVQKAIIEDATFKTVLHFLSNVNDHPDLTSKVAKYIAELAKTGMVHSLCTHPHIHVHFRCGLVCILIVIACDYLCV
jgi:hypothetical protein